MIDLHTNIFDKIIDGMNKSKNYFIIGIMCIALIFAGAYYAIDYADAEEVSLGQISARETLETKHKTRATTVGEFLEENDVQVGENDLVIPSEDTKIKNSMNIEIKEAFEINISVTGKTESCYGWPGTVEETLEANNVEVTEDDIVDPTLEEQLEPGITIAVKKVTLEEETITETIKFKTSIKYDDSIDAGETKTVQKGKNGEKEITYMITYEDDEEVSREVIDEKIVAEVIKEQIIIGTKGAYAAPSEGEGTINGNNYTKVYNEVKAYSYYMGNDARGASGNLCTRGTCAVDPNVIPLGTRLYIEGYGYAVANDTGGNIKGKTVDLYMSSTNECYAWGVKYIKVYVLE